MDLCDFKSMASYKIIDHLYDERKDFIILGLCGRVGSGVSTISKILEKKFDDLQLPQPGFDGIDDFSAHEYRILYTYARINWLPFYKIRTSALITRYILDFESELFLNFLMDLYDKGDKDEIRSDFEKIINDFFTQEMICDWKRYYDYHTETKADEIKAPWMLLKNDKTAKELEADAKQDSEPKDISDCEIPEFKIKFIIRDSADCVFQNQDIAKVLRAYAKRRHEKSGFKNPFWYLLLKQYLYEFLPQAASALWNEIRKKSQSLPTLALQYLGNNLRMSKSPYNDENKFFKDGYICLAEEINLAIKVLRAYQLILQDQRVPDEGVRTYRPNSAEPEVRTVIVIDSIKNPYESLYLKARYSNYYLIGVYTEDTERRKRLREHEHFVDEDIRAIDMIEENKKFKEEIKAYQKYINAGGENTSICETPRIIQKMYEQFQKRGLLENLSYITPFVLQNVSSCLDSADILINNITDNNSYTFLKKTLLRYVCLIMNPGIVLPTPVERCMQIAYTAKLNSGCISRQVGAVVTDSEYHLLSVGWNQQPEGQIPCSYRDLCELHHHWDNEAYSDYESDDNDKFQVKVTQQVECFFDTARSPLREKGKLPNYCFKDYQNSITDDHNQVHTRSLHGEETAFLNLSLNKDRAMKGILFTTSSPCELCAKKARYLGISTIYYVEAYAGVSQKHVLNIGKKQLRPNLVLFTGAIGTAYTKLFTPLLPQKNENEMWLGAKMDINLFNTLQKGENFPNA